MDPAQKLNIDQSQSIYQITLTRIHEALAPFVDRVETISPGHTFGRRVFNHMLHLEGEDEAGLGQSANSSIQSRERELFKIVCGTHDIGRVIAALPVDERCRFIPAERLGLNWNDDRTAQHNHGELGVHFLRHTGLLNSLPSEEIAIVEQAIWHHSLAQNELPTDSKAYRICNLLRERDQVSILLNPSYSSCEGVLRQFLQWGIESYGMTQTEAKDLLNQSETFSAEVAARLSDLLNRKLSIPDSTEELEGHTPKQAALYRAMDLWFTTPPRSELVDLVTNWIKDPGPVSPTFSKPQMIENYPSYMMAQVLIALQLQTPAAIQRVIESKEFQHRLDYITRFGGSTEAVESLSAINEILKKRSTPT